MALEQRSPSHILSGQTPLEAREQPTEKSYEEQRKPTHNPNAGQQTRSLATLALAVVCALALSLLFRRGQVMVPKAYALCSREGSIYTVDAEKPQVECIVVYGNQILSTGSIDETKSLYGDVDTTGPVSSSSPLYEHVRNGLKFYYLPPGHAVIPGLADAHAHILEQGFKRSLDISNASSSADAVRMVKEFVLARPDVHKNRDIWIQGMGWDQTKWPGSGFPTAADFDSEPELRGRFVRLERVDVHAIWVSQRVVDDLGELPREIEGGSVIRDADGAPTGIFVDNAMDLVKPPAWTDSQMIEYYHSAISEALSYGLTSIHDAWATPSAFRVFKRLAELNQLPLRLYLMAAANIYEGEGAKIERFEDYGPSGRLTQRSVKLMGDGALGSWGAALIEPYTDKPEQRGTLLYLPEETAMRVGRYWDDFQVNVHCIGDRANNVVLDIFESRLWNTSVAAKRPRIEHAQIMTSNDLERISHLGVIPSVQPTHATSDMWYAESRLGPERIKSSYAYATLLRNSKQNVLPLGSDFPVEGVNPLLGFYAAVTRLSPSGESPNGDGGWFPAERLTRAEALKGMTLDPAYASFKEDKIGSLASGKQADFVIFDTNIMTVPTEQILSAKVVATVVDGRPMYGKFN